LTTLALVEPRAELPTKWVAAVELDGVELPLDELLASVTVRVGRDDAAGEPTPSSATVTLRGVDRAFTRDFRAGGELRITGIDSTTGRTFGVFLGDVSYAELDVDVLALTAAGRLAAASRVELDVTAWTAETWSARAARMFEASAAGGEYVVDADPDFDPILEPPVNLDTGTVLVATYLSSLASSVGAALVDDQDGRLVAQALGSRSARASSYASIASRYADYAELAGAGDYAELLAPFVLELDPALVAFAPSWLQPLDVVNMVGVQYGPDDSTVVLVRSDVASMNLFGRRRGELDTTRIAAAADADTRARLALTRAAYPRWSMRALAYLEPIPGLAVGDRVRVTELPPSSPTSTWTPVVEGWTHQIDGPLWTMELALSDPMSSGLAITWADVPPTVWEAVPPLEWREADSPDDFYP
jgi:hypothetical protein